MKKIITSLVISMLFLNVNAADNSKKSGAESQSAAREKIMRRTGGFVIAPAVGRGIKIVNVESGVSKSTFEKFLKAVSEGPRFGVTLVEGKTGVKYMPNKDCGAVLVFKDDSSCPFTIMTAPEQGWASINVAPLKADSPSAERFDIRVRKEAWRALVYMLGAGNNQMPACLMKPCANNKDIDSLKTDQPTPESFREMSLSARKLGIAQARMTTYHRACMEGWAEPPKNEYQKVIWDKVHATPKNPLKIEFDPKKGR